MKITTNDIYKLARLIVEPKRTDEERAWAEKIRLAAYEERLELEFPEDAPACNVIITAGAIVDGFKKATEGATETFTTYCEYCADIIERYFSRGEEFEFRVGGDEE